MTPPVFAGYQQDASGAIRCGLWTLTEDQRGPDGTLLHPKGSTVSTATLMLSASVDQILQWYDAQMGTSPRS